MTDPYFPEKPERVKKPMTRGRILRRILMVLAVMVCASLGVLSMLGGNSALLRDGLESYLTQASGYDVRIGTLEKVTFFPTMTIQLENLQFHQPVPGMTIDAAPVRNPGRPVGDVSVKPAPGPIVARVGKVDLSMAFFDVMFARARYRALAVDDVMIEDFVTGTRKLVLETLSVVPDDDGNGAALTLRGTYGKDPVSGTVTLVNDGTRDVPVWRLSDGVAVHLAIGPMVLEGTVEYGMLGGATLHITRFGDEKTPVTGTLGMTRDGRKTVLNGDMKFGESHVTFDLALARETQKAGGRQRIEGTVAADPLAFADIGTILALEEMVDSLIARARPDATASVKNQFYGRHVDVALDVKRLTINGRDAGRVSAPLRVENGAMTLDPIVGEWIGGTMSGMVAFNAPDTGEKVDMAGKIHVDNLDFGEMQDLFTSKILAKGYADLRLDVTGSGPSVGATLRAMNGRANAVSEKGEFTSNILNLWGGGLLNALLPNFSGSDTLAMNCALADFKITNGVAESTAFLIDSTDVTVTGEGRYNISKDHLDFTLSPKSKSPALLTADTAVNITGPIGSPSISPDAWSVGKKLGGLLLSTINPIALAYTLTDLGLTDQHPCAAHIKGPE